MTTSTPDPGEAAANGVMRKMLEARAEDTPRPVEVLLGAHQIVQRRRRNRRALAAAVALGLLVVLARWTGLVA